MRTVRELGLLASEAGGIWLRYFTRMGFWFCLGFALHLLGNLVSVRLGSSHLVVATLVFVVGLIASVASVILMIHSCEPALRSLRDPGANRRLVPDQVFTGERRLDVLALTVGPFLAVYSVWGLVDDEVSSLFVTNVALKGLGGVDDFSVNLQWVTFYVSVAIIAWVLRQIVALIGRRTASAWLLAPSVLLEGLWVVASFLALFAVGRRAVEWLRDRAVWQGARLAWYGFLDLLPDLRLPFDLTLPQAVDAAVGWLWSNLLPGVATAVLLPLMWLALTATVYGWRTFSSQDLVAGTALQTPTQRWQRRLARAGGRPGWVLVLRTGQLLTADLQTKYLPVAYALRLVLRAGPAFVGAYLVGSTIITAARELGYQGVDLLVGPQVQTDYLARQPFTDLPILLITTTATVALYAAAFDRVVGVSVGTPPAAARSGVASEVSAGRPPPPAP